MCHPCELGQLVCQIISLIERGAMLLLDFIVSSFRFGQNPLWNVSPYLLMALYHAAGLLYRTFNSMSQ